MKSRQPFPVRHLRAIERRQQLEHSGGVGRHTPSALQPGEQRVDVTGTHGRNNSRFEIGAILEVLTGEDLFPMKKECRRAGKETFR